MSCDAIPKGDADTGGCMMIVFVVEDFLTGF